MDGGEIVLVQLGLGCALLPALFWETKVCQVECHWYVLVVIRLRVTCSMHVTHAKRAYTVNTAAENTRIRHPPTNNAYVLQYSDTRAR
jgi:hypothetical protein